MTKRKDGKVGVSFRISLELEKAFHQYWANRNDRISKSDLFVQSLQDFLAKENQEAKKLQSLGEPVANGSVFD